MTLRPPTNTCLPCGNALKILKTRAKDVHFPAATIRVKETQLFCPDCKSVWSCPEYAEVAPPRFKTSWALITWVGQQRFHENRQIKEIRATLARRDVQLSAATIVRATEAYLERYVAIHADPDLWNALLEQPHQWQIDGTTTEEGGGLVFVVRANGYTVATDGVPSESQPNIEPVLEEVKKRTGAPVAVGRDFSKGETKAVAAVIPKAVHAGCHFHFLRDAGKDALGAAHVALQEALSGDHVRARLQGLARQGDGEWGERVASIVSAVFESKGGLAFPFRRPALEILDRLDLAYQWACDALASGARANRHLPQVAALKWIVERYRLHPDGSTELARRVRRHAYTLERVGSWFDEVRDALRVFREGAQDERGASEVVPVLDRIEKEARAFGHIEGELGLDLVGAVRKRWDELFAPVVVDGQVVQVDRTIAEVERSHRSWKYGVRRRTGKARVGGALRHHGTGLALVGNWEMVAFREALGGCGGLVARLRDVGADRLGEARRVLRSLRPAPGRRKAHKKGAFELGVASPASGLNGADLPLAEVANH